MTVMGRQLIPALLIAGVAASASAQQKGCEIDEGTPQQVTRAVLSIQIAQQSQKPEDAATKLKDAVKLLNDGDLKKNPVGRAYELGKALVLFSTQPAMAGGMTTRGAVGFIDNPTGAYDLYSGIDSAFSIVEASSAACAEETAGWRQQKAWVDLVNRSIEFSNKDELDSAVYLANRSLLLSKAAPYGYMVLAQAAEKHGKPTDAIAQYKLSIAAAKDTSAQGQDVRRQLQVALANAASNAADTTTDEAAKKSFLAEAKAAYDALAADPGTKFADVAKAGQARVAQATGDTASLKASYAQELANPSNFNYGSLMSAAVTAARANQTKDAITLFEAARGSNPYHRDVLYNLARLYLLDSLYDKGLPIAQDLLKVDPNNPDNYQLLMIGYAARQKAYATTGKKYDADAKALGKIASDPKSKPAAVKAAIDSAARLQRVINAYNDSAKVMTDSALKYNAAGSSIAAKVTFNEFTPSEGKVTLGGTLANQADDAKSFTLKVDFLDKSGNVVNSQSVDVGSVEGKRSKPFKVEGTGEGIVAFRYAPLN